MARISIVKIASLLFLSFCLFLARPAKANIAVIDGTAIAKAAEQLAEMKKQLSELKDQTDALREQISIVNDVKKFNKEMSSTLGEMASFKLPLTSLAAIKAQFKEDTQCLIPGIPDFGINFNDLNTSLCDRTKLYSKTFFAPEDITKKSWEEQAAIRLDIQKKSSKYLSDTVARSLAQTDKINQTSSDMGETADNLQSAIDASKDLNDRSAIQAQTQLAILRTLTDINKALGQLLKLQAAVALKNGVDMDSLPSKDEEEN